MACRVSGQRMGDLMQNGVGDLCRRVVRRMVSTQLNDLLFLFAQADGSPRGTEAESPAPEPVPVHEFPGLASHFEQPFAAAVAALSVPGFEQCIRHPPQLRPLAHRRGSLIEFLDDPGHSRSTLHRERHVVTDIELGLYPVCFSQVSATVRFLSKCSVSSPKETRE